MTDNEKATIVALIRQLCSETWNMPLDYPFFHRDYLPGESADNALYRLFQQERAHNPNQSARFIAEVLIHG